MNEWDWMKRKLQLEEVEKLTLCLGIWPVVSRILLRLAYHLTPVLPASAAGVVGQGGLGQRCLSQALGNEQVRPDLGEGVRHFVQSLFAPLAVLECLMVWQGDIMPISDGEAAWLSPPSEVHSMFVWPPNFALTLWRGQHPGAIGLQWNAKSSESPGMAYMLMVSMLNHDDYLTYVAIGADLL